MKVIATEYGFDGVKRRKPGDVFDFSGPLGRWMKLYDGQAQESDEEDGAVNDPRTLSDIQRTKALKAADTIQGPTKQELIAALKEKGIKFKVTMKTSELAALLAGGGLNDSPENTGTGNQDVI